MQKKIPKKNPDIIWKNVRGETVLLNPESGKYYGLNKVGCAFWEKADGKKTVSEIATLLLDEFSVEKERLIKDLEELMTSLIANNLLSVD